MDPRIQRLHQRRLQLEMDIRSRITAADTESRELTAEEETAIENIDTEIRGINDNLTALLEAASRSADIDAAFDELGGEPSGGENDDVAQLRSFLRGERQSLELSPARRDLTVGSPTGGGNTVPTTFHNQLVEHLTENAVLLSAGATVIQTTGGETIEVPTTTAFTAGTLEGEGDPIAESDPAFAKRSLGAYKYAALIEVSHELIDDTAVDLLGFIARQAGRGVGNSFGAKLVAGTGSNEPAGIVGLSTVGKTGATGSSGAFTAEDLIDLFYSVIAPYRNSRAAGWLMRDASVAAIRKLKGSDGHFLWQPALTAGTPDTLLGKPVFTDPNVPAVALGAKSVLFGDISAYWARLAGGVRFERSDHAKFANDLVVFKAVQRGDGMLVDQTGAVKHFAGGAS